MKRVTKVLGLSLLAMSLGLTGCASIIGDTQHPVSVMSSPEGATFEIRNENGMVVHRGSTPASVSLKGGDGYFDGETYTIKFTKDGHEEQVVTVESSVYGWYWGNLLLGGLIGMLIVDPLTGAMYTLPETVSGSLGQSTAASEGASGKELSVMTIDQLSPEQRGQLKRIGG